MNKEVITKVLIFAAGAGIGAAVTWKLLKTKYEQIAAEEIESVKESFANRKPEKNEMDTEATEGEDDANDDSLRQLDEEQIAKVKEIAKKAGYIPADITEEKEEDEDMDKPYVIAPEEYGELDYALVSLTYYNDGTVTNDDDKIVGNVDELVGKESLNHFGEYEEDSVFVRNDALKIDFEILKDYRDYSELS